MLIHRMNRLYFLALAILTPLMAQEEPPIPQTPWNAEEIHGFLQEALVSQDWWGAIDYAEVVLDHFPESEIAEQMPYIIGKAYFEMGLFSQANEAFTEYLNQSLVPKNFTEVISCKFQMAEQLREGEKCSLFGSHKLPKIADGKEEALRMYDDVIATVPHQEMAARSLLGKAEIYAGQKEYKLAQETLDLLIRRFPKTAFAAAGYLEKSRVYLLEGQGLSFDPATEDLVEINLKRFRADFPQEKTIEQAEKYQRELLESFAAHLYETGAFFEKTKKHQSALLYYQQAILKYPETHVAEQAREKVSHLQALSNR